MPNDFRTSAFMAGATPGDADKTADGSSMEPNEWAEPLTTC